jgi:primary-amine oxidase
MVDGHKNTIVYDDVVPLPFETEEDKKVNPYGVGFKPVRSYIEKEGFADLDVQKARTFKIINESKINPISQKPVGYKIHMPATQRILAHPNSTAFARADFANHDVWVSSYRDNQFFSPGRYTNQSRGTAGGLKTWIKEQKSTRNEDNVLWLTYGLTHIARVEDFPCV